jgi:hypothetical protein
VIAIAENIELGIDPLDTRNVLEGISILTSVLGVSGSLLRHYGVKTVSPLVYRVGNWTVMTALAGDVGTLAFISQEGLAQLRVIKADPTKDDAQKNAEFLRISAQLFASGALFFASNKDLLKQGLKPSDFFKSTPKMRAKEATLSTGSRLDLGLELKKAGDIHTANRISTGKIADTELLDRHAALPWLKTGSPADVAELSKRLQAKTLSSVGDAKVAEIRQAMDAFADDALFDALAARWRSGVRVRDAAMGMAKLEKALAAHPDRVASMKRGAELEARGAVHGFDAWVKQTTEHLAGGGPDQIKNVNQDVGELDTMHALAAEAAGDRNKVITFTPAPPTVPGQEKPRSFDITITDRRAGTGGVPTGPARLIEVETVTTPIGGSLDLHAGVAHAASKLPLDRPDAKKKGGPKSATVTPGATLPTASKEAAVVVTHWPPPTTSGGKTINADGSWKLKGHGPDRDGHLAKDLKRELNGAALDRSGAQYLDRVTIIDGKTGRKILSLRNQPPPKGSDGGRHLWEIEE